MKLFNHNFIKELFWILKTKRWRSASIFGCTEFEFDKNSNILTTSNSNSIGLRLLSGFTPINTVTCLRLGAHSTLKLDGAIIGRGVKINVAPSAKLSIGQNSYITDGSFISSGLEIFIGKNCAISFGVTIIDDDGHMIDNLKQKEPIRIEDNVWIGCNVTVLKGTTLGAGCAVAAGSVVTKSFPPNSLIGGVPARIIRTNIAWSTNQP